MSWGKICPVNHQMKIVHSVICTKTNEINQLKLVKSEPLKLTFLLITIFHILSFSYILTYMYIGAAQWHDIFLEKCNFIECFRTCCIIMHSAAMDMVTWAAFTFLVTTKTKIRCRTNIRTVFTKITRRACYKSEDYNTLQSRYINKFHNLF